MNEIIMIIITIIIIIIIKNLTTNLENDFISSTITEITSSACSP
jgi:hypothetical protein